MFHTCHLPPFIDFKSSNFSLMSYSKHYITKQFSTAIKFKHNRNLQKKLCYIIMIHKWMGLWATWIIDVSSVNKSSLFLHFCVSCVCPSRYNLALIDTTRWEHGFLPAASNRKTSQSKQGCNLRLLEGMKSARVWLLNRVNISETRCEPLCVVTERCGWGRWQRGRNNGIEGRKKRSRMKELRIQNKRHRRTENMSKMRKSVNESCLLQWGSTDW